MGRVIERVYIHNYKCLVNFELRLHETVLLLGTNGVGKTAVLDVLFGLRKLLSGEAKITDRVAFHPSTLTRWQARREQVFSIQAMIGGESFVYRLGIEHMDDGRRSRIVEESLVADGTTLFRFDLGDVQLFRDDGSQGPAYTADWSESALARVVPQASNTRLTAFMDAMQDMVVCTIRPSLLGAESTGEDRQLNRDADNFANWYRQAVLENPSSTRSHVEALRPVIEGFNNLHLQKSGLDSRALMFDFDATDDGDGRNKTHYELRFDELSDGHRTLVVLYALLRLRREGDRVLLFIDEPDNFVALPEIQPWLMALVDLCEETPSQALVCSHHPELIDYLGPDHGIVMRREASSVTTATPLAPPASENGLKLSELVARGWEQ